MSHFYQPVNKLKGYNQLQIAKLNTQQTTVKHLLPPLLLLPPYITRVRQFFTYIITQSTKVGLLLFFQNKNFMSAYLIAINIQKVASGMEHHSKWKLEWGRKLETGKFWSRTWFPILEHRYSDIGLFGILDKAKEVLRFVHIIISRLFHYFSFNQDKGIPIYHSKDFKKIRITDNSTPLPQLSVL